MVIGIGPYLHVFDAETVVPRTQPDVITDHTTNSRTLPPMVSDGSYEALNESSVYTDSAMINRPVDVESLADFIDRIKQAPDELEKEYMVS